MQLFLVLAGLVAAAGIYETIVYVANRRPEDRNEDARKHRIRRLSQEGDV